MANTKKYVSFDKLGKYDAKIKKYLADADTATLNSAVAQAKAYADGLAVNYDEAGAAATALADAKAYADGKDEAIAAAHKAGTDAAAAAKTADDKAVAAQGEVDALEAYVGTFTATEGVDTVVKYIDHKTNGIAFDADVSALADRVTQAEKDIDAIEADYLKAEDKTELAGDIADVQAAVDTEKGRAEGVEAGLDARIKAVEDDYLKAEDKTELADAIADEAERAAGVEEGLAARIKAVEDDYLVAADKEALQTQINTIMNNPDAEGAINSINEFTQYVKDHGTIAEGFRADIDQNKTDIAANKKAIEDHVAAAELAYATKTELADEKKNLQDEIDADVKVVADDLAELAEVVAAKADTTALNAAVEALDEDIAELQAADEALDERVAVVEGLLGDGDGSVADQIADLKAELQAELAQEIADAKTDASNKDVVVLAEAQKATEAVQTNLDTHANNADIHVTTDDKAKWNAAAAVTSQAHTHNNFDVLEGITSAKVNAWDNAEGNAKTYADGLNTAMNARVEALETWHDDFIEVSEEEINSLFA